MYSFEEIVKADPEIAKAMELETGIPMSIRATGTIWSISSKFTFFSPITISTPT